MHRLILAAWVGLARQGWRCGTSTVTAPTPHLSNLAYGTHAENIQDAVQHGTHWPTAQAALRRTGMTTRLCHFTCSHAYTSIGEAGLLAPLKQLRDIEKLNPDWRFLGDLIWFTDLDSPNGAALSSYALQCDRRACCYRVDGEDLHLCVRWLDWTREHPEHRRVIRELNMAPDALPGHWWVATEPVSVTP